MLKKIGTARAREPRAAARLQGVPRAHREGGGALERARRRAEEARPVIAPRRAPRRARSSRSSAAPTSGSPRSSTASPAAASPSSRTCPGVTRDRNYADVELGRPRALGRRHGRVRARVARPAHEAGPPAGAARGGRGGRRRARRRRARGADERRPLRRGPPAPRREAALRRGEQGRHRRRPRGTSPLAEFYALGFGDVSRRLRRARPRRGRPRRGDHREARRCPRRRRRPRRRRSRRRSPRRSGRRATSGSPSWAGPNVGEEHLRERAPRRGAVRRLRRARARRATRSTRSSSTAASGSSSPTPPASGGSASIAQTVEAYSVVRAMKAIDQAEVVACLLDATEAGVEQDARLLGLVAEKGEGARRRREQVGHRRARGRDAGLVPQGA